MNEGGVESRKTMDFLPAQSCCIFNKRRLLAAVFKTPGQLLSKNRYM